MERSWTWYRSAPRLEFHVTIPEGLLKLFGIRRGIARKRADFLGVLFEFFLFSITLLLMRPRRPVSACLDRSRGWLVFMAVF